MPRSAPSAKAISRSLITENYSFTRGLYAYASQLPELGDTRTFHRFENAFSAKRIIDARHLACRTRESITCWQTRNARYALNREPFLRPDPSSLDLQRIITLAGSEACYRRIVAESGC
jgi:hypothetical protein